MPRSWQKREIHPRDTVGQTTFTYRYDGLQYSLALRHHIPVPETGNRPAIHAHEFISFPVVFTTRVLAPVNLDHQHFLPTCKICEIRANDELPYELEAI